MGWDPRMLRNNLRLVSALVLLAFVLCHLTAHAFCWFLSTRAEAALNILMYPWRTAIGTAILVSALLAHYLNALWSIYVRRYLRLSRWEWWQLGLGLCIPLLLMLHVTSTRIAESLLGVTSHYSSVLIVQWLLSPWLGGVAGNGRADRVDPRLHRHPFLAAHQAVVYPLAAIVCRLGPTAADLGALRLCHRGQSGAARRRESKLCEIIARSIPT